MLVINLFSQILLFIY